MSRQYILAHDVGTQGSKAVLVALDGRIIGSVLESYEIFHPRPHWAEQAPEEWWRAVVKGTRHLLEKYEVQPKQILCMTFSTQMLGIIPMSSNGQPLRPAIIWLDSRADAQAQQIMRKLLGPKVFALVAGCAAFGKDVLPSCSGSNRTRMIFSIGQRSSLMSVDI